MHLNKEKVKSIAMPDVFEYKPPNLPVDILYYDAHFVVVDKPSGLLSVPGKGEHLRDCLISRVQKIFPESLLVHRLDLETSGVMLFALTRHAQRHLGLQFEKRQVKKTYIARVWGEVSEKMGEVDLPLIVDWPNRPRQKVCHETGKIRGLLCNRCNMGIGLLDDDISRLEAAIRHLNAANVGRDARGAA